MPPSPFERQKQKQRKTPAEPRKGDEPTPFRTIPHILALRALGKAWGVGMPRLAAGKSPLALDIAMFFRELRHHEHEWSKWSPSSTKASDEGDPGKSFSEAVS